MGRYAKTQHNGVTFSSSWEKILGKFPRARIMVLGDLILDEYIWGSVDRISPEAPVPVVWGQRRTHVPGGAANVAHNIRSLSAEVCLVGVTGTDKNRDILVSELKKRHVSCAGVVCEPDRHTTVKTRIIAGHQQVVRVDWEHKHPLSREVNGKIAAFVEKHIGGFDGIIIEDYGKGVINRELLEVVIGLARSKKKIITVDPKQEHFQYYRGVSSITPNRKELENAVLDIRLKDTSNRFRIDHGRLATDAEIEVAARHIVEYLGLESLLVTLGEGGMMLVEDKKRFVHIPTLAQEVFDVSGAGDTVIATFTLALCCGAPKKDAALLANCAAGIVVGKLGTAVTDRDELSRKLRSISAGRQG